MELSQNIYVVLCGFLVWLLIAPRAGMTGYADWFLAYMAALLLCLIGAAEVIMVKPVAFFFTIGGVLAFCYVLARARIAIRIKK
jgi:Flp pilus assembly protein TadB